MAEKKLSTLTKGVIKENPVLRLVLGTCPTLAITTAAINGIGMGVAATLVLIGSNAVISLLRNVIPEKVRIPAFITIIAAFVSIIQMLVKAFLPGIDAALGIFLPLIVVNCIILARAEMFASKNPVLPSILDAIGMGIGFTAAITLMGMIRELLGAGTIFGLQVTQGVIEPMLIFILPPGGFFVFGVLVALSNKLAVKMGKKPVKNLGCGGCNGCSGCDSCGSAEAEYVVDCGGIQLPEGCEPLGESAPVDEGVVTNADIAKELGEKLSDNESTVGVIGDGVTDENVRTEAAFVERSEVNEQVNTADTTEQTESDGLDKSKENGGEH